MNERIRELAEQTGLIPKTFGPVVQTRHMKKKEQDLEKFAELIVEECARLCTDYSQTILKFSQFGSTAADDCSKIIKEHFGD